MSEVFKLDRLWKGADFQVVTLDKEGNITDTDKTVYCLLSYDGVNDRMVVTPIRFDEADVVGTTERLKRDIDVIYVPRARD